MADGRAYLASRGLHVFDVRVGSPQSVLGDLPVELPAELFPLPLPGVADSGLPVRYSVTEGPAVVDGPVLRLTGLGTVTLRAQQDGDLQFLPLDEVRSFLVTGPPVIEVGELSGGRIQLSWPLSAGGYSLEYSVAPGLNGATWSLVGDPVEVVGEQIRVRTSVEDSATRWFRLRRN